MKEKGWAIDILCVKQHYDDNCCFLSSRISDEMSSMILYHRDRQEIWGPIYEQLLDCL